MIKRLYILVVMTLLCSCERAGESLDDTTILGASGCAVERTEDGRLKVTGRFDAKQMTEISTTTRVASTEDKITSGWCLVFGEDETHHGDGTMTYTDDSPLIMCERVTANANGFFMVVLEEYHNVAFMRIVANLTEREDESFATVPVSWRDIVGASSDKFDTPPTSDEVEQYGISTFGLYRDRSVGLDGLYDMTYTTKAASTKFATPYVDLNGNLTNYGIVYTTAGSTNTGKSSSGHHSPESYNMNKPDPTKLQNLRGFPMASFGLMMESITEATLSNLFGQSIYMIRTCSKVVVKESENLGFDMKEVYLIDAAQEARIRSTMLKVTGEGDEVDVDHRIVVPEDLGGSIDYLPMPVADNSAWTTTSNPIYFYPNTGGDYDSNNGAVNQDINPIYVIVKGRAAGYDTDGYYKIALKAQYPFYDGTISELTYDILRNVALTINLIRVDKPGYLTIDDAKDPNNPASNISYSIVVDGKNSHNEFLISNGSYFVELEGGRIYVKGYGDDGITGGEIKFTLEPNAGDYNPNTYLRTSGGVDITEVQQTIDGETTIIPTDEESVYEDAESFTIPAANKDVQVKIIFSAKSSGRVRLRIGDILKYIPVRVEEEQVDTAEGVLSFANETSATFEYYHLKSMLDGVTDDEAAAILKNNGVVAENIYNETIEFRSTLYTDNGVTKVYFKQHAADTDAKEDGVNVIPVEEILKNGPATAEDREELTDMIIDALINKNKTTIYLNGEYLNDLFDDGNGDNNNDTIYGNITLFEDIRTAIAAAIAAEKPGFDENYTYSLDLAALIRQEDENERIMSPFAKISPFYFANDPYLKSLILPPTVNYIGANAFSGCSKLATIAIGSDKELADVEKLDNNTFVGLPDGATITIYNQHNINDYLDANSQVNYKMTIMGNTDGSIYGYKYVLTKK